VGDETNQTIIRIRKEADGSLTRETGIGCRFVPLIGEQGWQI
jgi:protein-L-isoaspartate(D-aspartate) O-methyltransferase